MVLLVNNITYRISDVNLKIINHAVLWNDIMIVFCQEWACMKNCDLETMCKKLRPSRKSMEYIRQGRKLKSKRKALIKVYHL